MTKPAAEYQYQRWSAPEIDLVIEYPLPVMEEIRAAAGGPEVSGVLFGKPGDNSVRILAWRPISGEQRGQRDLLRVLLSAKHDPDLEVLQPVGWFLSHVAGGISLTESDLEIYNGLFGEPWQVTLVLQPAPGGAVHAGFFAREASGGLRSDASYREFVIQPLGPASAAEPRFQSASSPDEGTPMPRWRVDLRSVELRWLWAIPALLAVIVGGLLITARRPEPASPSFFLRIQDAGRAMQIAWDPTAAAIRESNRADVDIQDGAEVAHFSLSTSQLREGRMTYQRHSGDVQLRMTVHPKSGGALQEFARLVVPAIQPPPPPAPDPRDAEVKRLKEELRRETVRADKMEKMVKILENRIAVDAARK